MSHRHVEGEKGDVEIPEGSRTPAPPHRTVRHRSALAVTPARRERCAG